MKTSIAFDKSLKAATQTRDGIDRAVFWQTVAALRKCLYRALSGKTVPAEPARELLVFYIVLHHVASSTGDAELISNVIRAFHTDRSSISTADAQLVVFFDFPLRSSSLVGLLSKEDHDKVAGPLQECVCIKCGPSRLTGASYLEGDELRKLTEMMAIDEPTKGASV